MRSWHAARRITARGLGTTIAALLLVNGCATATAPPARIQEAIGTVNRYLPEYVAEANKTFTANNHPDRERLAGIGDRMVKAVDALNRWAHGQATQTETPR